MHAIVTCKAQTVTKSRCLPECIRPDSYTAHTMGRRGGCRRSIRAMRLQHGALHGRPPPAAFTPVPPDAGGTSLECLCLDCSSVLGLPPSRSLVQKKEDAPCSSSMGSCLPTSCSIAAVHRACLHAAFHPKGAGPCDPAAQMRLLLPPAHPPGWHRGPAPLPGAQRQLARRIFVFCSFNAFSRAPPTAQVAVRNCP